MVYSKQYFDVVWYEFVLARNKPEETKLDKVVNMVKYKKGLTCLDGVIRGDGREPLSKPSATFCKPNEPQ